MRDFVRCIFVIIFVSFFMAFTFWLGYGSSHDEKSYSNFKNADINEKIITDYYPNRNYSRPHLYVCE